MGTPDNVEALVRLAAEADRISKLSYEKMMEYFDLLAPYDGKRIIDIPLDILKNADALLHEAQLLDKKWDKLAGI